MQYLVMWVILIAIGLVVGFIIHAIMRFAQGGNILSTLLAGIVGALIAAFYAAPNVVLTTSSLVMGYYVWVAIGAAVLSVIVELFFVGSRRGRVVTS